MGYVGVIGQQEGMDLLVAAADHLIRGLGLSGSRFVVVGFGPELEAVRADVARRGLGDHFEFTGALYGDELLRVLNSCDVGVAPDPKNAMNDISTMNKVMEYMTLKLPVVQFDLTEGRASAGDASLYARANDPADFAAQIARLAADPDLRRRMGEMGRARVLERLSWDASVPPLLAAYDRAFAKLGHAPPPRGRRRLRGAAPGSSDEERAAVGWASPAAGPVLPGPALRLRGAGSEGNEAGQGGQGLLQETVEAGLGLRLGVRAAPDRGDDAHQRPVGPPLGEAVPEDGELGGEVVGHALTALLEPVVDELLVEPLSGSRRG